MLILPAIDLIGGRCVRLAQGDYAREKVYSDDPVAMARKFADQGAQWLHIVDLEGARAGRPSATNLAVVSQIAKDVPVKIEFGGGIKSEEAVDDAFEAGVGRVVLGSVLVKSPEFARKCFERLGEGVVAGIDCRDGRVATTGWLETSDVSAVEMAERVMAMGARRIILTDIARDGMLTGPNLELLSEVAFVGLPVIQSGGIATLSDLRTLVPTGVEGAITGRAIYEGKFTVREAVDCVRTP